MSKNAIVRKTSRIAGAAAVLGAASALLLLGVPADAAVHTSARGVAIALSRGV